MMNPRERFHAALLFGRPDRVPFAPGAPRESTVAAWAGQGLPAGADYLEALCAELGIDPQPHRAQAGLGVSFTMIPEFEQKVLAHRDGHYIVQDWMGAITEISDRYDYTYLRTAKDFVTRKWHRFPVESRADWVEKIAWRYDPRAPARYPAGWAERCLALQREGHVLHLHFNGPFWQLREWCGLENLCLLFCEQPAFVQEMVDFWAEFVSTILAELLQRITVDHVEISEDMAYKAHSMISPAMVRRFLLPVYRRWVAQITAGGVPAVVDLDCDGYIAELIPLWIEAGINCCSPLEIAAGNDPAAYRRLHGRRMAYRGGIDKRAIAAGGPIMEQAVLAVVPPLLAEGGYIPGCDHGVPPDISWPAFVEYARLLARLTGWL